MKAFPLTISSPDGNMFSGNILKISLRGASGDLAVMHGHTPFITTVVDCDCEIVLEDETEKKGHTSGGILSVSNDNVTLLSGTFTW